MFPQFCGTNIYYCVVSMNQELRAVEVAILAQDFLQVLVKMSTEGLMGWEDPLPSSVMWLLAGGLSSSFCAALYRIDKHPRMDDKHPFHSEVKFHHFCHHFLATPTPPEQCGGDSIVQDSQEVRITGGHL